MIRRDLLLNSWRMLTLCALMFWQGGFFFYAAAVVPTAQEEIGHRRQGFVTRKVTVWINNAAVLSLAMLAVDAAMFPDPRPWRRRIVWGTWLAMVLCQVALVVLHPRLDALLDLDALAISDRDAFKPLHRAYLWVHTIQWALAAAYVLLLVAAWRRRDRTEALREV